MSRFHSLAALVCLFSTPALGAGADIGRPATPGEIAAWNTDIRPDGQGLPPGQGSVLAGDALYSAQCAACHGDFGEGVGRWPALAGGADTLGDSRPQRTIGSYWPYATTIWDYVNRTMPYGNARSLTADQVYGVTAYLLYLNDLVGEDFILTRDNLPTIKMPNARGFHPDDRATTERPLFSAPVCMAACKARVTITQRAAALNVTPDAAPDRANADKKGD